MKTWLLLLALVLIAGSATAQIPDLILSEYIEGSSYNKALEIYNGTGNPVDLSDYSVGLYFNGSAIPVDIPLGSSVLGAGECFVIAHPSAAAGILAVTDLTSTQLTFNGNDALVLVSHGEAADRLGQIGVDPGTGWSCVEGSTVNATLRRDVGSCQGDENPASAFDPCLEWDFYANDSFDDLGSHSADCQSVGNEPDTWDALKAVFR